MRSIRTLVIALCVVALAVSSSSAATTLGAVGDQKTSIQYDAATGNFTLQPDSQAVGLFQILSASGIFSSNATLPPGGLGFDVNSATEKSWAALPASAVNADFNLGNIAAANLTQAFLLGDLTLVGSGGFGTANRDFDLVYKGGQVAVPPVVTDAALGNRIQGAQIMHQFATSAGTTPISWGSLTPVAGNPAAATAPTLGSDGKFSWNSHQSPIGNYAWDVTATNSAGSDVGRLTVSLIVPEPATLSLIGLAMLGLAGLFGRRR